jgi:ketosteroid isomerase-like protein
MSEENVDTIREVYERYSQGDLRASAEVLDVHAVLVLASGVWGPEMPAGKIYVGAKAIADYTRESLLEPWADFSMQAEEIIAAGDSVLVRVLQSGVGRTSGVPTELRYFTIWSFRGPKVIRIESFRERGEALEAAGLSE